MEIPGYDDTFPYELGDVFITDEQDDLAILLSANYAYVYFWYCKGVVSEVTLPQIHLRNETHIMCTRIDRVSDDYKKIGHIDLDGLNILQESSS